MNAFAAIMMALVTMFSAVLLCFSTNEEVTAAFSPSAECGYGELFDKYHVMEIEIRIDEAEFADILENPAAEEYKKCDITVDGETYANAAIRAKGNTSLSQVADSDSDRYSFKVEFDHYVSGQSLEGLDKLVLNNIFCDATYVKEYMAYDIFSYLGVACPYYCFAHITINGEEWGLYLALEAMEDAFVERVYGPREGELYKPESANAGEGQPEGRSLDGGMFLQEGEKPQINEKTSQGNEKTPEMNDGSPQTGGEMPQMDEAPPQTGGEMPQMDEVPPQTDGEIPQRNGRPQKRNGRNRMDDSGQSGGGSDLVYTDDAIESYQDIFDHAVFSPTDEDKERVIEALKNLSEGKELEKYFDVDACLRYFAAQTFIVNMDSYYSNLKHNYYLYEENGQLTILPWDLNLAFGGFQAGSADDAVNSAIDTPMGGELEEARPLFSKLMEIEEYKNLYHQYLNEIIDGYIGSGKFTKTFHTVTTLIGTYVQADVTAFYGYEEYLDGIKNLREFILLRAESVAAQLDGEIPSTTAEQKVCTNRIDASAVELDAMGVQGGDQKGGKGGPGKFFPQTSE